MCEVQDWIIDRLKELGATRLTIEHGGTRGCRGRHRGHPVLIGEFAGQVFKCPLKGRPKDKSSDYRWSCLRSVCDRISELVGYRVRASAHAVCRKSSRRDSTRKSKVVSLPPALPCAAAPSPPTILSVVTPVACEPVALSEADRFAIVDRLWLREHD